MDWINKWRENLSVFLTAAKVLHDTTINSGERDKLMFELIKARTMVTSRLNMQEDMHVLMFGAMKRFDLNASFNDAQYEYIDIETTDKNDVRIITYCVIGSVYNIPAGTYEYRYDIITGELLSVMEFSGSSVKQQYAKTTDDFGRTGGVRFTLDNGKTMGYTYTYKSAFEDTVSSIKLPNGKTAAFTFDDFGRLKTRSVNTSSALQNEYTYCNNRTDSSSTTPLVSKESLIVGNLPDNYSYTYDSNNNILTVKDGSSALLVSYEYDGLNRLIRENIVGGNTTVFKYDKGGNLQYKKVYSYSTAAGKTYTDLLNGTGKTISYGYGVSSNKDLLTSYNGSGTLEYDNYGNPQKWFKHGANGSTLGYTLQWGSDDRLVMVEDVAARDIYTYIYNDQGIRTVKFVNDVMHTYYLQGEQIIAEMYGNNFLKFYYDSTGICGFNYNGTDYYYQKNIQGDILKIFDGNGTLYAEYGYDAWGKCTIKTNVNGIAKINPFRYRGYYLDDETGLYYLNSRYYDSEIGRFISPDSVDYLAPESINGLNLYAYCLNNPIKYVDVSGRVPIANSVIKITATKQIWGFDNFWWGRVHYSVTATVKQSEEAGIFYVKNTIDNSENSWGAGINLWGWLGVEVGVNGSKDKLNAYIAVNVTPWVHGSLSFGLNGITLSLGINVGNTSHDFSIGIGLAPVIIIGGIALLIVSAGQAIDVVFNWFKSIFGF